MGFTSAASGISPTLAAYVGEDVTIRFDPRNMAEIRVFYRDRFLCGAISADLAGETVPFCDIARARGRRRRELRSVLQDRQRTVDELLMFRRSLDVKPVPEELHGGSSTPLAPAGPRLKRYTTSRQALFIETLEYRRFVEFCDACRRERYIGLCFGSPGIGKTLSAVHYSGNELLPPRFPSATGTSEPEPTDTVFYTTGVINTPSRIDIEVRRAQEILLNVQRWPSVRKQERHSISCASAMRTGAGSTEMIQTTGRRSSSCFGDLWMWDHLSLLDALRVLVRKSVPLERLQAWSGRTRDDALG